ncbi:hypothetical protein NOR53_3594 [gamma proteobacterium NOR5-3]|nr:hypothetical protein NOR53_3594 [gamma proteobacterium NOR5-3]
METNSTVMGLSFLRWRAEKRLCMVCGSPKDALSLPLPTDAGKSDWTGSSDSFGGFSRF